jgi:hypothetical protein
VEAQGLDVSKKGDPLIKPRPSPPEKLNPPYSRPSRAGAAGGAMNGCRDSALRRSS